MKKKRVKGKKTKTVLPLYLRHPPLLALHPHPVVVQNIEFENTTVSKLLSLSLHIFSVILLSLSLSLSFDLSLFIYVSLSPSIFPCLYFFIWYRVERIEFENTTTHSKLRSSSSLSLAPFSSSSSHHFLFFFQIGNQRQTQLNITRKKKEITGFLVLRPSSSNFFPSNICFLKPPPCSSSSPSPSLHPLLFSFFWAS